MIDIPGFCSITPSPNKDTQCTPKHTHTYTPARCHPKDIRFEGGLLPTQMARREMRKPAKSDNMCAASVMIARLPARYPPAVGEKRDPTMSLGYHFGNHINQWNFISSFINMVTD